MMRDNMTLSQNSSYFSYKCPICSQLNHFIKNCPKVHYFPNKNFLISRLNHSQPQVHSKNNFKRKLQKLNTLKLLSDVQNRAFDLQKDMDEEKSSEYSESENQEPLENMLELTNIHAEFEEKSQKETPKCFTQAIVI